MEKSNINNSLNITKDQIKEVLSCFQDYCRWMYFDKSSGELNETRISDGEKFIFYIREDGNYGVKMPERNINLNVEAIYKTVPIKILDSKENVGFFCRIINKEVIPPEIEKIVNENVFNFISSLFTRTIALCLFARLQPVSLEEYGKAIYKGLGGKEE